MYSFFCGRLKYVADGITLQYYHDIFKLLNMYVRAEHTYSLENDVYPHPIQIVTIAISVRITHERPYI